MQSRIYQIPLLYAFSAALTALLALTPALAILAWPEESTLQILQQKLIGVERGVGFALLTLCLLLILRRAHRARRRAPGDADSRAEGHAARGLDAETGRLPAPARGNWRETALMFPAIFAPALPLLAYLWNFNDLAYAHLFLGDQDFTNISTAINQTALGRGLLTTPFLNTGPTGSYLGHHFSPLLIVYAPFYWLADVLATNDGGRPTHFVYAICLWATLALGLLFWARLIQKEIPNPFTATACMALICGAYPLWRLALSYHYELPVIPLSALTFLALGNWRAGRRSFWFWLWLILWMANKEDIAIYVGLFAVYLASHRGETPGATSIAHMTRALSVGVVALAWLLLALGGMDWIGGAERVDWIQMWSEPTAASERSLRPGFFLLLAFAFVPALNVRYFMIVLLPLLLFHYLSQQAWHHNYLGHYSYAILPFLFFGLIRGFQRLESAFGFWREARGPGAGAERGGAGEADSRGPASAAPSGHVPAVALVGVLACGFFAAGTDRYMPLPRLAADPRFATVERVLQRIPAGACLQTQSPFTAHAPLNVQIFPLMAPTGNPAHNTMPGPHNFDRFYFQKHDCKGYYLLLDRDDPMPPFYMPEHLTAFEEFAQRNLIRLPIATADGAERPAIVQTDSGEPGTPRTEEEDGAGFDLRLYRLSVF
ncbi:MAG: DUF2079 domain-containing protein [Leptospirales bacterium]|jgi:hypothetical protein